ncbi:MAG TPA: cbb3-type cytochrome c oxidase subunit II [Oscillatoriaceae cyanobacterium]
MNYERFFAFHNSAARIYVSAALLFVVLTILTAVIPAIEANATPPSNRVKPYTPLAEEGRALYIGEGCGYCHTQQVRPLPGDKIFGPPSLAGDYAYDKPMIAGTERTGPDLSNVGARQPNDTWHLIHLWNPRAVVPNSVMPSYSWYFVIKDHADPGDTVVPVPTGYGPSGKVVVATHQAMALVAYLKSLNRTGPAPAQQALGGGALSTGESEQLGAKVYAANCATCHQTTGRGVAGVFPPLDGDPIVAATDASAMVSTVLHGTQNRVIGGVKYPGQMPAFKNVLTPAEIAAVTTFVRESWRNHAPDVTTEQVIKEASK